MIPIIRPVIGDEEIAAVAEVLRSGWLVQGPRVEAFEAALAAAVGAPHVVAVSSATAGLHLALRVAGIGAGDDVIVPSLSFIATTNAAWMAGARPVFADVAPDAPNLTCETVDHVWTPATRAVIAVHQLGVPFDRDGLRALCRSRGALLVEDAACAIGSDHRGEPIARDAELAVFSFHPRKVITTGEGGAVATGRSDWADRLRRLRQHGMTIATHARKDGGAVEAYAEPGWNYRMTDLQAAIGVEQLRRLDAIVAQRQAVARRYDGLLADVWDVAPLSPHPADRWNVQTYCLCVAPDGRPPHQRRDAVLAHLQAHGVGARRGILAAHLEPAWHQHPRVPLPCSEAWAAQSLALPVHAGLDDEHLAHIVAVLRDALERA